MAKYRIDIDDEDAGAEGGDWTATLIDETPGRAAETISVGIGNTPREAVGNIDWHHDWTRHQIAKDKR